MTGIGGAGEDEYEIARLYADPAFARQVAGGFAGDALRLSVPLAPPLLAPRDKATGRPAGKNRHSRIEKRAPRRHAGSGRIALPGAADAQARRATTAADGVGRAASPHG